MKRKVTLHGPATLSVSLPLKWARKYGVRKGDEVDVIEHENGLYIGSLKGKKEILKIDIDISELDRTSILVLIQSLYRYGYDEININTKKLTTTHYRTNKEKNISSIIHEAVNRLIGSELISSSTNKFTIKYVTKESEENLDIIIRRIFLLLLEMMQSYTLACEKNEKKIQESLEFQHNNIKKFINYSLRLLNKYGHPDVKKTSFYFSIISSLSKIEDLIKNASRTILSHDIAIEKGSIPFIKQLDKSIRLYYELFYKCTYEKMGELSDNRDRFKNRLFDSMKRLPKNNILIITGLAQMLEILLDMTELRVGLEE